MSSSLNFDEVKKIANGMLPARTYSKIFDYAKQNDGNIVEVGTAHGAASICLAHALDQKFKVFTFEKIMGGSREKFGGVEENLNIIQSNYRHFGVDDRIEQLIGDVDVEAQKLGDISPLKMLVLDADGRLDRDFIIFYERLIPGGYIVIDDCDDRVKLKLKGSHLIVDQKHKLTFLFIKKLEELGILEPIEIVGNTYFGRKPGGSSKPISELSISDVSSIYANLVFCKVSYFSYFKNRALSLAARVKRKLIKR